MADVLMYSTRWCPFCVRAKRLLDQKGVNYRDIDVGARPEERATMMEKSGQRTVPQIWIGSHHVGGCDELFALERAGRLDAMLANNQGVENE